MLDIVLAGARAGTSVPPVRERVEKWESERATINSKIRLLERELSALISERNHLTYKITDAWASRCPSLNDDVLEQIFEHIDPLVPFHEAWLVERPVHFLKGLCLVNKQWLGPARRVLYREIRLSDQRHALERTLRQNALIRPFVRRIFIQSRDSQIGDLLHQLPAVKSVWSDFWPTEKLHEQLLAVADMKHFGIGREVVWDRGMWNEALQAWPALDTLVFNNRAGSFHPEESHGFRPAKGLKTLCWQHSTLFETAVPPTVKDSLAVLSIVDTRIWHGAIRQLLARHIGSLERLEITQSDVRDKPTFLSTLRLESAKQLRFLSITFNTASFAGGEDALPMGLVEVRLDWPGCTTDVALQFMKKRSRARGGRLKKVGLAKLETGDEAAWKDVYIQARRMGVKFRAGAEKWSIGPAGHWTQVQ